MQINRLEFNANLLDILHELRKQLKQNHIDLLHDIKDGPANVQVTCIYHADGNERKPSAGIKKDTGVYHCFRGDTKVITREYGSVCMNSIVNIPVHILNGKGNWEQVIFRNYGKQRLLKLELSCNTKRKIIYATSEHEWLIKYHNRKYKTQDLLHGMYLQKCVPNNNVKYYLDPKGIIHGYCYGDGSSQKYGNNGKYCNHCFLYNDNDKELIQYFGDIQFTNRVAGNGKIYPCAIFTTDRNLKEVPNLYENDNYLMGFLAGYFVADGNCYNNKLTIYSHNYENLYKIQQICTVLGIMSTEIGISNIHKGKRGCIDVKNDTYGYTLRLVRKTLPDNFFITSKGRNSNQKYSGRNSYKVISVKHTDIVEDVYCCQTSTHSFALENFILTGNCFACGESHDLPDFISNCFGRNDLGAFGWQWLMQNFYSVEVEDRNVTFDINRSKGIDAVSIMDNGNNNDSKRGRFISEEELDSYRWNHPYWEKRGITDESIIELFDLGYDRETESITFPVRDIEGHCLFVARRSVRTKFFNYPEGVQKPLYGLYELYNSEYQWGYMNALPHDCHEIIVCESMIDCILLWQEGHYAVALNGLGNQLQMQQLRDLPCRRLILATDNDNAGYSARDRIRASVKNKIITEIQFPDDVKDIGECTKDEIKHILDWERL